MKVENIRIGSTYSDQKEGLRRVLEIGAHLRTWGRYDDAVGVSYEVLMASKAPDLGTKSTMELKSFASWAKLEIPAEEVQAHLVELQAGKIAGKLTDSQRAFLRSFDNDLTEAVSVECSRKDFRAAAACREKGILTNVPDLLAANEHHFDVKFSALGLAVLVRVLGAEPPTD